MSRKQEEVVAQRGRPKLARQMVFLKLSTLQLDWLVDMWHHKKEVKEFDWKQYEELGHMLTAQRDLARDQTKKDFRVCVHGLRLTKAGRPKRLTCSLCEARTEAGKPLLWSTHKAEEVKP